MAKQTKTTEAEAPRAKMSRYDAAHKVVAELDGEADLEHLIDAAEEMVVESGGGKADRDATEAMLWDVISSASLLGVVETTTNVRKVKK
jgi:hypothetical protein